MDSDGAALAQAMKQQEGSRRVELGEPAAVEDAPGAAAELQAAQGVP